jgi:hypothetical protein
MLALPVNANPHFSLISYGNSGLDLRVFHLHEVFYFFILGKYLQRKSRNDCSPLCVARLNETNCRLKRERTVST